MRIFRGANLALRFVLELSALAIGAYWGWKTGSGALRWVLAIGVPLVVIGVWGLFVAPKRRIDLARPARLAIELAVFGAAAAALWSTGQRTLAASFAVVAAASGTLNYAAA